VRAVLDVYEAVVAQVGPLPPWTLVIEHALLSDAAERERAVRGGFPVTVQHPLLWNMGSEMLATWGPGRTRHVNPLDQWLAAGASLAAGTDLARPFNPMTSVWGMITRGTKAAGVQGPEHAIDVATALRLSTMGTAALNHEPDRLGSITPASSPTWSPTPSTRSPPTPTTWPNSRPPSPSSAAGPCTTPTACSVPNREGAMRYEATATCLSWIPPTAVEGVFSLPFGMDVAHYDQPAPGQLPDVDALLTADAIRIANQLHVWIEVTDGQVTSHGSAGGGRLGSTTVRLAAHGLTFAGVALPDLVPPPEVHGDRVRFTQTAGGHTGAPVPRAVPHRPFWRVSAPVAWSAIALTLHADGSSNAEIAAASPFPRHYLYGSDGRLTHKTALIRYKDWIRQSAQESTPWEGSSQPVPVAPVRGATERSLADTILMSGKYRQHDLPGEALLSERPIADTEVHLLLDGLLVIDVDDQPVLEAGPGAIFDPSARTAYSKQHITVRAATACRLAVLPRAQLDSQDLRGVAAEQRSRLDSVRNSHRPPQDRS
jgi:hypothetical protein